MSGSQHQGEVRLPGPHTDTSLSPCTECYPELILKLLSLPLMDTIVDVVRTHPLTASANTIQVELLARLAEEVGKEASPWSGLQRRSSGSVDDSARTDEHYRCALDVALAARLGLRDARKISKFWKKMALLAEPSASPITPSPSDISDTGILPELSARRQEMLDHLLEKRARAKNDIDDDDLKQQPSEVEKTTRPPLEYTVGKGPCHSPSTPPKAKDIDQEVGDTTLVDVESFSKTDPKGKESANEPRSKHDNARPNLKGAQGSTSSPRSFIPRRQSATQSPSSIPTARSQSSVRMKRMMFENISNAKTDKGRGLKISANQTLMKDRNMASSLSQAKKA